MPQATAENAGSEGTTPLFGRKIGARTAGRFRPVKQIVAERLVRLDREADPLAVAHLVARLGPVAEIQEIVAGAAIDGAAASEMRMDHVVAGAALDVVCSVARVDEVFAEAAIQVVLLIGRLAAGPEVAPDDVTS